MPDTSKIHAELSLLRNEDLLSLARNQSAQQREEAIRILVERGSPLAGHPEIANTASSLIHTDPSVLKTSDPAMFMTAHKLPGLLDVVCGQIERTNGLQSTVERVSALLNAKEKQVQKMNELLDAKDKSIQQLSAEIAQRVARLERTLWQKVKEGWKL